MMDNIGIKSILLFTGLALSCDLMSQVKAGFPDEDVEAIVNPPLEENAAHILKFDSIVCHLGTLTEDDSPKTVRFSFTNVSDKPVLIDRVRTTCGCVSAGVEARRIPSGEKGSVTLKYVPKNHPGTIDTNAFVYVEGMGKSPVARLTLLGNVLPGKDVWARFRYFMGKLRLKTKSVSIDEVAPGKKPEVRILCGNSGSTPLRLSAVIVPSFVSFRTEPEVIDPGCEADIVIGIDADVFLTAGNGNKSFRLIVEGVGGKPSDRTITVNVAMDK